MKMPIITKSGKIAENIYLIDTLQFGIPRITTAFCYWDGKNGLLMDVGTSDNVSQVIRTLKDFNIPLSKIQGIVLTHYHFDHGGGTTRIWKKLVKRNPNFKIFTTLETKMKLQNAQSHLIGARTTFGKFVGKMEPLPEDLEKKAYFIVKPDVELPVEMENGYTIKLISTEGHSNDHCAPTIFKDGKPVFCFSGEAAGCLYHGSKLTSQSTSMPPNFNFKNYMHNLEKIKDLNIPLLGICHFGAISNKKDVKIFLNQHTQYMKDLRNAIIEKYSENPSTRYIIEEIGDFFFTNKDRVGPYYRNLPENQNFFKNLQLAITFGMMVDLGYRKPKYEQK